MAKYQPKPMNPSFKDITGKVFGRLTVIGYLGRSLWECRCDCGTITRNHPGNLRSGHSTSCGCRRADSLRAKFTKHGHATGGTLTKEYQCYRHMTRRCSDSKVRGYKDYGGRGIAVCVRWLGDDGFVHFMADMGPAPAGYSIERKDVNGNYCPENCCWIPRSEQSHNRRDTVYITANDGRTMRIDQWSGESGISQKTIHKRLRLGWSQHDAVSRPLQR